MVSEYSVKEFLKKAYYASKKMEKIIEELDRCKSQAMRTTPVLGESSSGAHADPDSRAKIIEKYVDLQREWAHIADVIIENDRLASHIIELLPDERQKALLWDRHIWRMSVQEMSDKWFYSSAQIKRILRSGYQDLAEIINKDPELREKMSHNEL